MCQPLASPRAGRMTSLVLSAVFFRIGAGSKEAIPLAILGEMSIIRSLSILAEVRSRIRQVKGMDYKKFIRPFTIGTALATLVFLIYQFDLGGLLSDLELKTYDLRFQFRGTISPQLPIVIVTIDQDSFDELNLPWPWPRDLHAQLIQKLVKNQVKLIALDVLFVEPKPDPREDLALAEAIKGAGNVILGAVKTQVDTAFGPKERMLLPTPLFREHALGYGPVGLDIDQDGVVRRAKLALTFQDRKFPHFAYQIYQRIVGKKRLEGEKISPVPFLINFRGPARTYPVVPYYRILRDEIEPSFFKDKIILVGAFDPTLHDVFPTPFSASRPTAGVEIQANFVESLVANDPIIPFPGWGHTAIFLILSFIAIWASVRFKPLRAFAAVLALVGVYALATGYLFWSYQLWVPVVPSLFGIVLAYGGITLDNYIREQRERSFLRKTFSAYLSPELIEEMVRTGTEPELGGSSDVRTAYFTDIASFSAFSELLTATQLVELLNEYLTGMTDILLAEGGTLDKYEGDAIVAFFGAPVFQQDHALRALRTALSMQQRLALLREQWTAEGEKWPDLVKQMRMRIGLDSGEIVTGNMGSKTRMNYTMMGDTVNTAARLEAAAKQYGIYIHCTTDTLRLAGPDDFEWRSIDKVRLVGKSEAVETVEIMGLKGQLTQDQTVMRTLYHQGLELYGQQKWDEAKATFAESEKLEEVFLRRPTTPSRVYIARCDYFKANPPGADWDGTWTLISK